MKYTITVNTILGSACFEAYESDQGKNFILLEQDAYDAIERFATQSLINYPELVSETILCSINEGGATCDEWGSEDEGYHGFSYTLTKKVDKA